MYADDNLGTWVIQSAADLRRGLPDAEVILDVLDECELEVSPDKSIFLLELRGPKFRTFSAHWPLAKACVQRNGDFP